MKWFLNLLGLIYLYHYIWSEFLTSNIQWICMNEWNSFWPSIFCFVCLHHVHLIYVNMFRFKSSTVLVFISFLYFLFFNFFFFLPSFELLQHFLLFCLDMCIVTLTLFLYFYNGCLMLNNMHTYFLTVQWASITYYSNHNLDLTAG